MHEYKPLDYFRTHSAIALHHGQKQDIPAAVTDVKHTGATGNMNGLIVSEAHSWIGVKMIL